MRPLSVSCNLSDQPRDPRRTNNQSADSALRSADHCRPSSFSRVYHFTRSSCSSHIAMLSIFYYLKPHNRVTCGASTISQLTPHFSQLTAVNMADIFPHQSFYRASCSYHHDLLLLLCHFNQYENYYFTFNRTKFVNIYIKMWKCVQNS